MIGKETIKYSLKNLSKRRSRSFLTILSIFIGIVTIFIFISFGWGLYNYVGEISSSSSADKIIVQSKAGFGGIDSTFGLTNDDLSAVESTAGIFQASGTYFRAAQIEFNDESKYVFLTGYDPKKPLIMDIFGIGAIEGRMLRPGDGGKIVLGYNYLEKDRIFSKAVSLNSKVKINGVYFKVVGFLEKVGNPSDDSQIYISNDAFEELYPDEDLVYNWVIAQADLNDVDQTIERVEKKLRQERDQEEGKEDFFVQSFQDYIEGFSVALDIVVGFVILIALVSVLVSAINTANTMITSVLERVKEIGIIKSIGAKNSDVFGIFLFESGFLGFVSGVLGVLVGWGLSSLGGAILDNLGYGFLSPYFSPWLFVGCVTFATLTGALSGIIPAVNAAKTNPVDALRWE